MASWFPCRHPAQVRRSQAEALPPQLRSHALFIGTLWLLGAAAGWPQGPGWGFLAWQAALLGLGGAAWLGARRLQASPAADDAALRRQLRALTLGAAACGCLWAVGLIAWAPQAGAPLTLAGIVLSLMFTLHAAATGHRLPSAVLAFTLPLWAACLGLLASGPPGFMAQLGLAVVAAHAFLTLRLLQGNWARFAEAVDQGVERERVAAMLQEQREIAERAVQLKTRFLAAASHDLRQPMHAISLYLDGLAALDLPAAAREAVADARLCAHDMNDMFRSLLDLSRLDAHQAVPALAVFPVAEVLARVERELQPLATARGTRLKVRPSDAQVYSDPVMVERIALNFASNAVRHAAGARVLVACRRRGRSLRLAVYDTGPGIPAAHQPLIFDEFRQLDAALPRESSAGFGLGLAIVRRLAQSLRLPLHVQSEPGRGSMFAVDLPLADAPRASPLAAAPPTHLAGRLIVVVDDEPSILQALTLVLQGAGAEVVGARSGAAALHALAQASRVPDAIVSDYQLDSAADGRHAIEQLREEFNHKIPALLVTGETSGGDVAAAARALGVGVLYKPLQAPVLLQALRQALRH